MSYCRLSEGDVYLYPTSDGLFCCHDCYMAGGLGNTVLESHQEALDHLTAHRDRGDVVPDRAFNRLRREIRTHSR